jgi:hypothetical protein
MKHLVAFFCLLFSAHIMAQRNVDIGAPPGIQEFAAARYESSTGSSRILTVGRRFYGGHKSVRPYLSTDDGSTWIARDTFWKSPAGAELEDPYVAFDTKRGIAYASAFAGDSIFVWRSTDGGDNWGSAPTALPRFLSSPYSTLVYHPDHPTIAVDNSGGPDSGRVYVCWAGYYKVGADTMFRLFVAHSNDHGISFTSPNIVDGGSTLVNSVPFLVADGTGELYILAESP